MTRLGVWDIFSPFSKGSVAWSAVHRDYFRAFSHQVPQYPLDRVENVFLVPTGRSADGVATDTQHSANASLISRDR